MLKREIRRWDLVLLMINGTIGAGIFGLPSKIFEQSGLYSVPAMLACAFIVFILVLSFAEVSSKFDKTGGPYLYTLKAFGQVPGFVIGWLTLITRIATFAALINLLITYLSYFYEDLTNPLHRNTAILIIVAYLFLVNFSGIKGSVKTNNALAIGKLIPLLLFILVGFFFMEPVNFEHHQDLPEFSDFSSSVFILIFAFSGFESVIVNTGEMKNPSKNLPFSLFFSLGMVAIFYILIQVVCIGTLPSLATSQKPLTDAAQMFIGPVGASVITIGAVISILGTLNAIMLIGSRMPFALSEENQFPKIFSKTHVRFHTPTFSLIFFGIITYLFAISGSFIYAATISVICKIMIFMTVCASLIKLRKNTSKTDYFHLKYGIIIAILGILISLLLLATVSLENFIDVGIAIAVGLLFYYLFYIIKKRQYSNKINGKY